MRNQVDFCDKDMLNILIWRDFFSLTRFHVSGKRAKE